MYYPPEDSNDYLEYMYPQLYHDVYPHVLVAVADLEKRMPGVQVSSEMIDRLVDEIFNKSQMNEDQEYDFDQDSIMVAPFGNNRRRFFNRDLIRILLLRELTRRRHERPQHHMMPPPPPMPPHHAMPPHHMMPPPPMPPHHAMPPPPMPPMPPYNRPPLMPPHMTY